MIADEFQGLLEILQPGFMLAFERVGHRDPEVGLGEAAPIAAFTVMLKSFLRVVARDCEFADAAINACQRSIDRSQMRLRTGLGLFTQRGVKERDSFRMIACVVISESDL